MREGLYAEVNTFVIVSFSTKDFFPFKFYQEYYLQLFKFYQEFISYLHWFLTGLSVSFIFTIKLKDLFCGLH